MQLEIFRLSPRSRSYQLRGRVYMDLDKYQQAKIDFDEAIRLNPEYADNYLWRAILFTLMGKDGEATPDVERAVTLGLDLKDLETNIGKYK